jgi:hypothetical protein
VLVAVQTPGKQARWTQNFFNSVYGVASHASA